MALSTNPIITSNNINNQTSSGSPAESAVSQSLPEYSSSSTLDYITAKNSASLGSGLNGSSANTTEFVSSVGNAATNLVNNTLGTIENAATNLVNGTIGTIENAVNGVVNEAVGTFNGVVNQLESTAQQYASAVQGVINEANQVINALQDPGKLISQAADVLAVSVKNQVNSMVSGALGQLRSAGTRVLRGAQFNDNVTIIPTSSGDWRVRIVAPLGFGTIVFPVLPTFSLGHTATYQSVPIMHSNYQFNAYQNSNPNDIQLTCEWPVETVVDGQEWISAVLLGRTLTKMFYGMSREAGQPPLICTLHGLSTTGTGKILPHTPVIIKSFQVDFRDDISYIRCGTEYVPRLSTITMSVTPAYSRTAQRSFNIDSFRKGTGNIRL